MVLVPEAVHRRAQEADPHHEGHHASHNRCKARLRPDGRDGGFAADLAVEGRGRVAEHGLLQRHPLRRAGVDRVGRRHPRRVGVRRRRVVVLPLGRRRGVVRDADGGLAAGDRVVLGRHGRRRWLLVRGSGLVVGLVGLDRLANG
jgi:hypothetical protein